MQTATKRELEERREGVKKYILNRPGEYISCTIACKDFGISPQAFANDFKHVVEELGGTYEAKQGVGFLYTPIVSTGKASKRPVQKNVSFVTKTGQGKAAKSVEVEQLAKKIMNNRLRNAEGYVDTTAFKAIRRAEDTNALQKTGEVWEGELSSGFTEMLLVLRGEEDYAICLKLTESATKEGARRIPYMGKTYFVVPARLYAKPARYIKRKLFEAPSAIVDEILHEVAGLFINDRIAEKADIFIKTARKEAEAIIEDALKMKKDIQAEKMAALAENEAALAKKDAVIKALEEQLEASKNEGESRTGETALSLALLKQKVEIYERLLFDTGLLAK